MGAGQVAASMGEGTLRLGSASIRATNGPGEALISALAAEELSCDANVQRILMSPAGKPLDIGRKTRSSLNRSGPRSSCAMVAASTRTAINPQPGPTPTTSNTGHAEAPPA